jgi:propionate CoA-transferase
VEAVREEVARVITPLGDKVDAVINSDGCSIDPVITEAWFDMARDVQTRFYRTASRYSTSAFMRLMLGDAHHDRKTSPHVFDSAAERGP